MNYFTQKRMFIAAIIILALLNVASLVTIWTIVGRFHDNERTTGRMIRNFKDREHFKAIVAEELQLNPEQREHFRIANEQFRERSRSILRPYHASKRAMLEELSKPFPDTSLIRSLTDSLGLRQSQLELATAGYFMELKGFCTPEQRKRFPELFHKMMQRLNLPEPPPPPPPPPPAVKKSH